MTKYKAGIDGIPREKYPNDPLISDLSLIMNQQDRIVKPQNNDIFHKEEDTQDKKVSYYRRNQDEYPDYIKNSGKYRAIMLEHEKLTKRN